MSAAKNIRAKPPTTDTAARQASPRLALVRVIPNEGIFTSQLGNNFFPVREQLLTTALAPSSMACAACCFAAEASAGCCISSAKPSNCNVNCCIMLSCLAIQGIRPVRFVFEREGRDVVEANPEALIHKSALSSLAAWGISPLWVRREVVPPPASVLKVAPGPA